MTSTGESSFVPEGVFHLAAGGELKPAVTRGLPSRVSGLPAFYYWKDAIVVGSYQHPVKRFSLEITRDRLDGYTATFKKMKTNGVAVPILMDHTASAAATLGWIVDVKRDGDRLMELHQFLGATARDIGLRNKVSLGIDPDFTDGKGNNYGEAIVHSAVTPMPVVPNQGDFEPAEEGLMFSLAGGAGGAEASCESVEAVDLEEEESETALESHVNPACVHAGLNGGLAPEGGEDVSGAMMLGLRAIADAAEVKRDLALSRGAIDPSVAEELFSLLVRGKDSALRTLTLSTPGNDESPLALAVFDVLSRNRPVMLGEVTKLQVLSRLVPGDAGADELQARMIALASGGSQI